MRISITGPLSELAVEKAEHVLNTKAKTPWGENIIDYAAETYKYFSEENVIFKGSPFDFLDVDQAEGYDDLYEQISIGTLDNVDYIAVVTMGMDSRQMDLYKGYKEMFPDKIFLFSSPAEFEIIVK